MRVKLRADSLSSFLVLGGMVASIGVFIFGGWGPWALYMLALIYGYYAGLIEGSIPPQDQGED